MDIQAMFKEDLECQVSLLRAGIPNLTFEVLLEHGMHVHRAYDVQLQVYARPGAERVPRWPRPPCAAHGHDARARRPTHRAPTFTLRLTQHAVHSAR